MGQAEAAVGKEWAAVEPREHWVPMEVGWLPAVQGGAARWTAARPRSEPELAAEWRQESEQLAPAKTSSLKPGQDITVLLDVRNVQFWVQWQIGMPDFSSCYAGCKLFGPSSKFHCAFFLSVPVIRPFRAFLLQGCMSKEGNGSKQGC